MRNAATLTFTIVCSLFSVFQFSEAAACFHADQHRQFVIAVSKDARRYATARIILHRDPQYGATAGASFHCIHRVKDGRQLGRCKLAHRLAYPKEVGSNLRFSRELFIDMVQAVRKRFLARQGKRFKAAYVDRMHFMQSKVLALWDSRTRGTLLCTRKPDLDDRYLMCGVTPSPCASGAVGCYSYLERASGREPPALLKQVAVYAQVCRAKKRAHAAPGLVSPAFAPRESVFWLRGDRHLLVRQSARFGSGNHINHNDVVLPLDLGTLKPLKLRIIGGAGKQLAAAKKLLDQLHIQYQHRPGKAATSSVRVRPRLHPLAGWLQQQLDLNPDKCKVTVDAKLDVGLELVL